MQNTINLHAAAVVLLIEWCDKEGRDIDGKAWHTREPDILQTVSTIQKRYQHHRSSNHIAMLFIFSSGLNISGALQTSTPNSKYPSQNFDFC
jgi:hypothetical protein